MKHMDYPNLEFPKHVVLHKLSQTELNNSSKWAILSILSVVLSLIIEDVSRWAYLQVIIQVIANAVFIMTDISVIRGVAEAGSYGLVYVDEVWSLHIKEGSI